MRASVGRMCARHKKRRVGNRSCLKSGGDPTREVREGCASRVGTTANSFPPIPPLSPPGQIDSRITNSNLFDALLREERQPNARQ
jgi:hypothetical protein